MILKSLAAGALASALIGPAQAASETYAIDPMHTFVTFEVTHFGTSTSRGRFDKKKGVVQLDRAGKSGQVELTLDTASIDTGVPALDAQLKSANFLNVAKFPSATFMADRFAFAGDRVGTVSGQLTLLGRTLPVVLRADHFGCYVNSHPPAGSLRGRLRNHDPTQPVGHGLGARRRRSRCREARRSGRGHQAVGRRPFPPSTISRGHHEAPPSRFQRARFSVRQPSDLPRNRRPATRVASGPAGHVPRPGSGSGAPPDGGSHGRADGSDHRRHDRRRRHRQGQRVPRRVDRDRRARHRAHPCTTSRSRRR